MKIANIAKKIKLSYVFGILAVFLLVISTTIFIKYMDVEKKIIDANLQSNISYIDNLTDNLEKFLVSKVDRDNIYTFLKNHKETRSDLESYLQLFVTEKYKYIYVVNKIKNKKNIYKFLLDGSKNPEDKSEFGESYKPLEVQKWQKAYKTKKPLYFTHKNLKTLWMTYLKPIVVKNRVVAIIVVDFSMKGHLLAINTLKKLDNIYLIALIFSIVIFLVVLVFSYVDFIREKERDLALEKVKDINKNLEVRIRRAVDENRQKDQAMFQQSRLAQMGEMINMIAHQWRQPLMAISATCINIILKASEDELDSKTAIALATRVSEYSQTLSTTIDDFRNFFKSSKEKKETTYEELIKGALNIIEVSIINKNIKLIQELNCKEKFFTYPNELKQVVLNIFKNAEEVLLEKEVENPYIKVMTYREKENLVLEIMDNGGGIPENIIDKIFDPYFSTKTEKDGTGLGLYMSKMIVEDHCKGKILVKNGIEGAIFKIVIRLNL